MDSRHRPVPTPRRGLVKYRLRFSSVRQETYEFRNFSSMWKIGSQPSAADTGSLLLLPPGNMLRLAAPLGGRAQMFLPHRSRLLIQGSKCSRDHGRRPCSVSHDCRDLRRDGESGWSSSRTLEAVSKSPHGARVRGRTRCGPWVGNDSGVHPLEAGDLPGAVGSGAGRVVLGSKWPKNGLAYRQVRE